MAVRLACSLTGVNAATVASIVAAFTVCHAPAGRLIDASRCGLSLVAVPLRFTQPYRRQIRAGLRTVTSNDTPSSSSTGCSRPRRPAYRVAARWRHVGEFSMHARYTRCPPLPDMPTAGAGHPCAASVRDTRVRALIAAASSASVDGVSVGRRGSRSNTMRVITPMSPSHKARAPKSLRATVAAGRFSVEYSAPSPERSRIARVRSAMLSNVPDSQRPPRLCRSSITRASASARCR